jgi:hypothetical protein
MPYKIYYSFLHKNLLPNLATKYELYRQEVSGSSSSDYYLVDTIADGITGNPALISGFDEVNYCNVRYNYKAIAFVGSDFAESIDAIVEGISFPCPSFTSTPTPTTSVTPTITTTPPNTPPPALSSIPFPTATNTPTSVTQTVTPTTTKTPSVTVTKTPTLSVTSSLTTTPTPTTTPTTSLSPTKTVTPTISLSPIQTVTPTISQTPEETATPTISVSPIQTVTPTISQTPEETVTPTISVSPTQTVTPTISQTPEGTVTPTISVSPTQTVTPTISVSPTQTVTPTISVSPTQTATPTISITPTQTTPIYCASSPVTITVESEFISPGNSDYKYITSDPDGNGGLFGCIDVNRGETLTIFVTGDEPNLLSHPIKITEFRNDGNHGTPRTDVTKTDLTEGPTEDHTYSLTWFIPCDETVDKYQYQCENHSHMRGVINVMGSCPTPSPTPTISVTPTQTITPTISVSPTQTITPTISVSPTQTITPTISVSPTQTITPTISATPTLTPTLTPLPMSDSVQTYMPIHMQPFLTLELSADLWESENANPGTSVPVWGSHSPNNWYNFENNRSDNTGNNFLTYPLSYAERIGLGGPQSSVFGFHGSSAINSPSITRIFKSPQATNESRTYCFWFKAKDLNRTQCLLCDSFMWNGPNDSINSGITIELNSSSHLYVAFSCFSKLSNLNFYPFLSNPFYNEPVPFDKPFSFSKWNHAALVVDIPNQFAKLYINKLLVGEFINTSDSDFSMLATNPNSTANANNSLTWGMRYFYSTIRDEHFRGLMNQMTVMENHISTSSTIENIYNAQSPYYNYLNNSSSAQSAEDDYFDF